MGTMLYSACRTMAAASCANEDIRSRTTQISAKTVGNEVECHNVDLRRRTGLTKIEQILDESRRWLGHV